MPGIPSVVGGRRSAVHWAVLDEQRRHTSGSASGRSRE